MCVCVSSLLALQQLNSPTPDDEDDVCVSGLVTVTHRVVAVEEADGGGLKAVQGVGLQA